MQIGVCNRVYLSISPKGVILAKKTPQNPTNQLPGMLKAG